MIIRCKSCGSNLRYDIAQGKLRCAYCGHCFDPEDFKDESPTFDAVMYTCQSCGAELITADDSEATAFCSYCGSTSILTGRLEKIRKPDKILPFKITKEKVREIYLKKAKETFLAPKWLKEESCIDSFRAIYMPYWTYNVHAKGQIDRTDIVSHRNGSWIETSETSYSTGEFDEDIAGWAHDASTAFADDISETIGFAEMNEKNYRPFCQGYLSGFYADMAEESQATYKEQAKKIAREKLESRAKGEFTGEITVTEGKLYYMPVWFMSMRHNGTLTYAAVNGYSGKIVADFPISTRGFLGIAGIAAAVISVLLSLILVLRPEPAFWIAFAIAAIGLLLCGKEEIKLREVTAALGKSPALVITDTKGCMPIFGHGLRAMIAFAGVTAIIIAFMEGDWIELPIGMAILGLDVGLLAISMKRKQPVRIAVKTLVSFLACICCIYALTTRNSLIIYCAALAMGLILSLNCLSAFRIHQTLARRRPPHFDRKGANDNA